MRSSAERSARHAISGVSAVVALVASAVVKREAVSGARWTLCLCAERGAQWLHAQAAADVSPQEGLRVCV